MRFTGLPAALATGEGETRDDAAGRNSCIK